MQFADLDKDSDGKIVIQDFYDHFEPLGVGRQRISLMFQMLDKNDDKKISIFEYESWRRKQTASDLQTILNVKLIYFLYFFHKQKIHFFFIHLFINSNSNLIEYGYRKHIFVYNLL